MVKVGSVVKAAFRPVAYEVVLWSVGGEAVPKLDASKKEEEEVRLSRGDG